MNMSHTSDECGVAGLGDGVGGGAGGGELKKKRRQAGCQKP